MARLLLLARGAIYIFHMAASHVVGSVLNLALLADPFFPPRGSILPSSRILFNARDPRSELRRASGSV